MVIRKVFEDDASNDCRYGLQVIISFTLSTLRSITLGRDQHRERDREGARESNREVERERATQREIEGYNIRCKVIPGEVLDILT